MTLAATPIAAALLATTLVNGATATPPPAPTPDGPTMAIMHAPEPVPAGSVNIVGTMTDASAPESGSPSDKSAGTRILGDGIVNVKCGQALDWYRVQVAYESGTGGQYCFARQTGGILTTPVRIPFRVTAVCPGNNAGRTYYARWGSDDEFRWSADLKPSASGKDCYAYKETFVEVKYLQLH